MDHTIGRVYLVGAGCGEADLITRRGAALLGRCDAVVYDDLIDPALLDLLPPEAERLYMGKRSGHHSAPQAEISAALVDLARAGKTVVRLKGGDPFVFGRGGEEIQALRSAGVPCEEVPGISSAIAIPALAGIPVTHRGASRGFHVITAHTADTPDGLPADLDHLARLRGTLVFLMGLGQLPVLARRLMECGMAPETPAAVVSGGNSPHPAAVRGTLSNIAEQAVAVRPPAVIVVGAVAAMDLSPTVLRPLQGLRVGLTGTAAVTDKLLPALREQGAQVFFAERSLVEPLPCAFALRALCDGAVHWLVFTSSNGVRLFFQHLDRQKTDLRRLFTCRFAVIGDATAETLRRHHIQADLCPAVYTSEALGQALCQAVRPGEDLFLFRSRRGSRPLFDLLSARFPVEDVPLYDLRADPRISAQAQLAAADYLTFSSASGVELFLEQYGALPDRATCVCIGAVTARALEAVSDKPFLTADEISADGIVRAILAHRR